MEDFSRYSQEYWNSHREEREEIISEHVARAKYSKDVWNEWNQQFKEFSEQKAIEGEQFDPLISFIGAEFAKDESDFTGYEFYGTYYFMETRFSGDTSFEKARFSGDVFFGDAKFASFTSFSETKFSGYASFSQARFSASARFSKTRFSDSSYFSKTRFSGYAFFSEASFSGDAVFSEASFWVDAFFQNSNFEKGVIFTYSEFKTAVPEFNFASFKQAPSFHKVSVPTPTRLKPESVERYRKLKEMAQSSKDHENELKFFGYETHAKAFLEETPWYKKLFIKMYYWFSNFGTSFWQPWAWFFVFMFGFFVINQMAFEPKSEVCKSTPSVYQDRLISYTASSMTPLIRLEKTQKQEMDACLFGFDKAGTKTPTFWHSLWRLIHGVFGVLFIFLFGLAVRNRFKIA